MTMFALLLTSFCAPLLAHASTVYLHPPLPNHVATHGASAVIAHHLRLERFEPMDDGQIATFAEPFVGEGESEGLVLSIEEPYAKDIIPEELHAALTLRYTSFDPLQLMSNLLSRAEHVYTHVTGILKPDPSAYIPTFPATLDLFSAPHPSTELFLSSLSPVVAFLEEPTTGKFGVFSVRGLDAIATSYGKDSDRYRLAVETLRATLSSALVHPTLRLVVLTSPVVSHIAGHDKRQNGPTSVATPPQLVSDAVCFASEDACTNATGGCSGHGSCAPAHKAGKECFVCACTTTKSETGRTQSWVGASCERQDVSGSFVLLAGTTVGLLVIVFGSVSLLWSMGSHELPSVLTGGVAPAKRD
ncbi:hypothetical protein K488DRAFT_80151 [Vararia minispora EC-137]|uniref:Uncharacterized protein n=1 Tax=Vararia minispora EC-137 TaxID=1314806 RepID=A0ACB8QCF8_9AGAM|nr:hypothetical protein K488DRAFT_80151 [Vararia minispora EC-137]